LIEPLPRLAVGKPAITRAPAGALLSPLALLVASQQAQSRADLVRATGLARSTVSASLDALLASGVLEEAGEVTLASRGRPAQQLRLAARAGVVLAVDVGVHSARLAVSDLARNVLMRETIPIDVAEGPEASLDRLAQRLRALLSHLEVPAEWVRAVVLGLPAPVDLHGGIPVRPPVMPGWDAFPVAETLERSFDCPALVDNEVNLMALGEARSLPPDQSPLLFIKVGTGIGSGLITADGRLHHGTDGAAGDIGHVRVPEGEGVRCRCGNVGCLEAVASVSAITARFAKTTSRPTGADLSSGDLQALLRRSDPHAVTLVKEAAAALGGVVAALVHFYNPSRVVLSGVITDASDHLLAGVRSVVSQRALPFATRNLTVAHTVLGDNAGLAGGIVTGIEHVLSPEGIGQLVRG
jgi:predicted NBD/HSP70 family sugar kinase